jgi:hypothetical protein
MKPLFGTLMNGTVINHAGDNKFVVPCDFMPPTSTAITLTLGGVDLPVQYRDLMCVRRPSFFSVWQAQLTNKMGQSRGSTGSLLYCHPAA